jgi:hypothetical protein
MAVLCITYSTISKFSYEVRRSYVLRLDGVIVYLVYVGVIRGIVARVRLAILVQSSCYKAKGLGLLRRAIFSIGIRRWRSSFGLVEPLDPLDVSETPLELVDSWPKEEGLGALVERKSTPEFFRVFAMSIKVTDLGLEPDEGINTELGWLYMQRGTKMLESI